ncbi:MAG: hypothetical protein ACI4U3_07325, partial [Traorella sp.]
IGGYHGMHIWLILWAISCEMALALGLKRCLSHSIHAKKIKLFIAFSAVIFMIAIILPYLPSQYPLISELHINLSFLGLLSLLVDVALLVISLSMTYYIYPYDLYLLFIYLGALGIFGANYMSVNSLVEVYLAILLPIYLYQLGGKLQ